MARGRGVVVVAGVNDSAPSATVAVVPTSEGSAIEMRLAYCRPP